MAVAAAHDVPAEAEHASPLEPVEYGSQARVARARPPTASSDDVDVRDIRAIPVRTADDALRLVPGFALVQHGTECKGHQFFLRGFDAIHGADLEVTLEGIPINEWSNVHAQGYLDLCFIIPETIRQVHVTKGPFTTDQGAFAMAGSADYRLGIAEDERGARLGYSFGTTLRQRALVSYTPKESEGRQFVAAEATHDPSFGQRRKLQRASLLGRVRLHESSRNRLTLLAAANVADFELPTTVRADDHAAGRIDFYDSYDRGLHGRSARGFVALTHESELPRATLRSSLYAGYRHLRLLENYTGYLLDPVHGDRRRQRQDTGSVGMKSAVNLSLAHDALLRFTLSSHADVLDQAQRQVGQDLESLGLQRALTGLQSLTDVGAELRLRLTSTLRLSLGGRLDVAYVRAEDLAAEGEPVGRGALWALSPRTILEWRAHPDLRLFAAYGRGFRPPEARAFTRYEPERVGFMADLYTGSRTSMTLGDSLELGARAYPGHHVSIAVSGFGTWIARETLYDHVSGTNLSLEGTQRLGAEVAVEVMATDWLTLNGDVTYVNARFRTSGNQVPLVPSVVANGRLTLTHPSGIACGLRFFALSPRPLPHGARGASWTELSATAGYRWRFLHFDVAVENVLNQRIRAGEYHYASRWDPSDTPSALPVLHFVAGAPINARFTLTAVF